MENRGKNGWGLPVVVAVGVFVYYISTSRRTPGPDDRRQVVMRRLHDGASPRTLLKEGFSPAELLNAGVAPEALRAVSPATPSTSPLQTPREESHTHSPGNSVVFSWVYDSLVNMTDAVQAASDALHRNLRGRSMSASLGEGSEAGRSGSSRAERLTTPQPETPPTPSRQSSIRLAPRASLSPTQQEFFDCHSPDRSFTAARAAAGATRVRVGALATAIPRGYAEESASYRFPLEVMRFLHEDGSRLSVMAESCSAVECGVAGITTDAYVKACVERARAAVAEAKTYFKVKLSTAAHNIATTTMETYVNIHVGPSPVILAGFYLVRGGIAYTLQLQTHTNAYEERLADLLYAAQNARLPDAEASRTGSWGRRQRGCNQFQIQAPGLDPRVYVVETPLDVAVSAVAAPHGVRSKLVLTPSTATSGGSGTAAASWEAAVTIRPIATARGDSGDVVLLRDAFVSVDLAVSVAPEHPGAAPSKRRAASPSSPPSPPPPVLAAVVVREAMRKDMEVCGNVYRSAQLTIPLPPPEHFRTVVCEHPYEPFVTLFITSLATGDLFEMELHCLGDVTDEVLERLFGYLETLLLTPAQPRRSVNAAGQACFSVEGLAVAASETTLRVYGVQLAVRTWLMVRWLCADSALVPRELEQYHRELVEGVVC